MRFEKLLPANSKRRAFFKKFYEKYITPYSEEERRYLKWIQENEPNKKQLEEQRNHKFAIQPKISIVVPVYQTPENFFKELVESLQKQTYQNWELCLADGSPEPIAYMQEYPKKDARIKYKVIGENKGISGNTNEAIAIATGDFIGLLDHDDLLPVFSLYEIVKAINENPEVEFLYTDEDKLEAMNQPRYGVFFKPDFSPYTLNSANYICHFTILKKELMEQLGGFRSEYDGSQDFDIVARASELTQNIVHIPKVLYHWRAHRNSTASNSDSKPYAFEIGKKVIKDHIKRSLGVETTVEDGLTPGSYKVKYAVKGNPKVSIIIDGQKKESSKIKTTYTNTETIVRKAEESINETIQRTTGDYFIILDDDFEKMDQLDWLEQLLGICQDETIGMVGTKLYNQQDKIEHCGIILGMNGVGDFLYRGAPKNAGTYMQRLLIIHNLTCCYIKYTLIDRKIFKQVGGFDEKQKGIQTSIDYSLKLQENKKQVVINPIVSICVNKLSDGYQVVEKTEEFIQKWEKYYEVGDRYFSPNLSKKETGLAIRIEGE